MLKFLFVWFVYFVVHLPKSGVALRLPPQSKIVSVA